jgi:hypothetical protein
VVDELVTDDGISREWQQVLEAAGVRQQLVTARNGESRAP